MTGKGIKVLSNVKGRKGFPTIEESIKFFEGMTPTQNKLCVEVSKTQEQIKRKVNMI